MIVKRLILYRKSIAIMPLDQTLFKQPVDKTKLLGVPYLYDKETLRIKIGKYNWTERSNNG